ncbi:MAG: lipocalin family protein [Gemmatimonadaceae bacterium]|nr:lipocalin family protein [Gemmatimonadaceae bacterium]
MRAFMKVAAIGLFGLAAACGGGDGINEPVSIAGTYNLETIDGQSPPVVVFDEPGFKAEILSGNFILAGDKTFTTNVVFRITEDSQVSTESESFGGTYAVSGSTVTFAYSDGDSESATLVGNTLTFTDGSSTAVFRK